MFFRILRDSFLRQKRRKAIVLTAVTLGTAAAAALADIALDVGDKVGGELKSFGANLVLLPRGGGAPVVVGGEDVSDLKVPVYLDAADLPKVKDNFWKNNILAFSPMLDVPARVGARTAVLRGVWFERPVPEAAPAGSDAGASPSEKSPEHDAPPPPGGAASALTGVRALNPYWSVEGRWPDDRTPAARTASTGEALVGRDLADALRLSPGDRIDVTVASVAPGAPAGRTEPLVVAGVLTAGDAADGTVLVPIETVWRLTGGEGRVSRVALRALTTPESAVYERLGADPRRLDPKEFERWICTPFVSSIAYELERAVPGAESRVVRRVADSEGNVLRRTSGLMALIALMAVIASALTVTSALTTSVLERRSEIGLLKAMGAGAPRVVALFVCEAVMVGTLGGVLGALGGAWLARVISTSVFGAPVAIRPLSVPIAVAAALVITCAGCIVPVRRIMSFRPMEVLRGL